MEWIEKFVAKIKTHYAFRHEVTCMQDEFNFFDILKKIKHQPIQFDGTESIHIDNEKLRKIMLTLEVKHLDQQAKFNFTVFDSEFESNPVYNPQEMHMFFDEQKRMNEV